MEYKSLQERLDIPKKFKTAGKVILGISASALIYANVMFGFAPTIDALDRGVTKQQIENAKFSLNLSYDGYHHSQRDPAVMNDAEIIKNLTRPGRELAYLAFSN